MNRHLRVIGRLSKPGTLTTWLTTFLQVSPANLRGCSENEIAEVEEGAGKRLPRAYAQALLEAGRAFGRGIVAEHFSRAQFVYPRMLGIGAVAREVIRAREGDETLLGRAFPFFNWEVYRICLLDLSTPQDDPQVLVLSEKTGVASPQFESFSRFMAYEISQLADAIDQGGIVGNTR